MSNQVIRHRGAKRDEDGKLIAAPSNVPLTPLVITPGGGSKYVERAREGKTIAWTVYFPANTDITNDDELTVHGDRFPIVVNDWSLSGRGSVEVMCTKGEG